MYFSAAPLFGKGPQQHEFGLEHRSGLRNDAVEGRRHPSDDRVANSALHVFEDLTGIAREPVPIQVFGHDPELNDQVP
jgi:hypothetical protein